MTSDTDDLEQQLRQNLKLRRELGAKVAKSMEASSANQGGGIAYRLQTGTRNRFRIAMLIYSMTNAVIFGAGLITVLNVSALRANAHIWIPVVVVASLILAAPIAWLIAPRLQARYDRWHTN